MYKERMLGYYPQVIKDIKEFQAIVDSEYPEFEELSLTKDDVLDNAYLATMGQDRIEQWEKFLGIHPITGSSLDDRRETIIARVRGNGKLNTKLINSIVNAFTEGNAIAFIEDSVLYVYVNPPKNNKQYFFTNIEKELRNRIPAHLDLNVNKNYYSWNQVKNEHPTWGDIKSDFATWMDVGFKIHFYIKDGIPYRITP